MSTESCPSGKSPVMQKISRKQLANPNGPQFAGSDEAACYQGCQNNLVSFVQDNRIYQLHSTK